MATVATLVVDMQANTAEFQKTWDATGTKIRRGGGAFAEAEKAAMGFAQKGLGAITQGVPGAERALERLVGSMLKSQSSLLKIGGGAVLAVTAFQQAFELGQKLGELLRETIIPKLTGQQSTEQMLEAMKKAQEEEKRFLDERRKGVALIREIEAAKAQAMTDAAVARAKADGDEAAAVMAQMQGRLALVESEKQGRIAAALEIKDNAILREQAITAAHETAAQQRIAINAQAAAEFTRLDTERSAKAIENLKKESDALQASIDRAVQMRQQISQQGSAAAGALGITGITGLEKIKTFEQNITAVVKKFHMLREEGAPLNILLPGIDNATGELATEFARLRTEIGNSPAQVEALDAVWRKFNFGDIRPAIERTRQEFEAQGIALYQVSQQIDQQKGLHEQLAEAARKSGASVGDLTTRMWNLERSIYAANLQLAYFNENAVE
jgi:hypothetical protein